MKKQDTWLEGIVQVLFAALVELLRSDFCWEKRKAKLLLMIYWIVSYCKVSVLSCPPQMPLQRTTRSSIDLIQGSNGSHWGSGFHTQQILTLYISQIIALLTWCVISRMEQTLIVDVIMIFVLMYMSFILLQLFSKLEWDKLAKLNTGPSHIDFKFMWIMAVTFIIYIIHKLFCLLL